MIEKIGLFTFAVAGGFVGTYAPLLKNLPRETCSDRLKHVAASIITGSIFLVMTYFLLESLRYNIINETYKYLLASTYHSNIAFRLPRELTRGQFFSNLFV